MSKELDLEQLEHVAGGLADDKQEPAKTKKEQQEEAADRERRKQAIRENSKEVLDWYREQLGKKR
jgi:hypothetical protein